VTGGTRNGMRAMAIFFLARVIRAAIVDSLTRNARATSAVVSPQSNRSVNATWASLPIAGWQHVNMRRRRSSMISATSTAPGSLPTGSTRRGRVRARTESRRARSMARRRATVVSQAPDFSGMPPVPQVVRARA